MTFHITFILSLFFLFPFLILLLFTTCWLFITLRACHRRESCLSKSYLILQPLLLFMHKMMCENATGKVINTYLCNLFCFIGSHSLCVYGLDFCFELWCQQSHSSISEHNLKVPDVVILLFWHFFDVVKSTFCCKAIKNRSFRCHIGFSFCGLL